MNQILSTHSQVSRRRRLARWFVASFTLLVILIHAAIETRWLATWPSPDTLLIDFGILALGVMAFLSTDRLLLLSDNTQRLNERLQEAERAVGESYQRLTAVARTSQLFAEASDEKEVCEVLLRLAVELVGAKGACFVPLDERGQTLPALSVGERPYPQLDVWLEYLASPAVRQQCHSCQNHGQLNQVCPLLQGPFSETAGVYCLPLRRGEHEFGVLNLYIPQPGGLDSESQAMLRTIVDETSLALEGVRLRKRELATLSQLQAVREKVDLNSLLFGLLNSLQESLETDYAMVLIWNGDTQQPENLVTTGELPPDTRPLIDGILHSVLASRKPVLLGNVAGESTAPPGFRALMAAPLVSQDGPVSGALFVANRRALTFNQRQLSMLQTVAGQVATVVQNYDLVAELEYKTLIAERTRLAREIHDGLAQTLGFLKLKAAQMINYLNQGEVELLRKTVQSSYDSLSEAYLDVRQAIDGLRVSSFDSGLPGWLQETVREFQEYSGLSVHLCEPVPDLELPPEVHAQLIRIVQEALSNIRKHAQANQVWVSCQLSSSDLILEIRDDGEGFCPEDVPGPSQHGLRGMRERAELIGADFQILGRPEMGTTVRIRRPLETAERIN